LIPGNSRTHLEESRTEITSGFRAEEDIDYNLTYNETGADNDWRWQEQWLPHAAWYMLAVCSRDDRSKP
jgi:hypothetical protein